MHWSIPSLSLSSSSGAVSGADMGDYGSPSHTRNTYATIIIEGLVRGPFVDVLYVVQ